MPVSQDIIQRDKENALKAKDQAISRLRTANPHIFRDDITGSFLKTNRALITNFNAEHKSLVAISDHPFNAMVYVNTVLRNRSTRNNVIWYVHEGTAGTQVLDNVVILPWTHPGAQIALTEDIEEAYDIDDPRYTIIEITPLSRARFHQVLPEIVGIYDPGGRVGEIATLRPQTGLKAVKLQMTNEQVKAFISKMKGVLLVTGAPGSGKTTVALQRMRFLFDKGDDPKAAVEHTPDRSRVFLANQNLIDHSKSLLEKQLEIPSTVLTLVSNFVEEYLDDAWRHKHEALLLSHPTKEHLLRRGREAFFSTCLVDDLKGCWKTFDIQVVKRLSEVDNSDWTKLQLERTKQAGVLDKLKSRVAEFSARQQKRNPSLDPLSSEIRMDRLYASCAHEYEGLRTELLRRDIEKFDGLFLKWLFHVYDPLDAVSTYFGSKKHEGALRIKKGTASRIDEEKVLDQIFSDFSERRYRREEMAWLAWLLRFALPSVDDPKNRFREVPNAESPIADKYGPWSHVVIDEAQDLSVVEASLLSSFVEREGALTIAADFRQVVSPVHGMENPNAFKIGCRMISLKDDFKLFPFKINMRQTGQIGNFLRGFYQKAFGEMPPFMANDVMSGPKPQLQLMPYVEFAPTIRKALNVFRQNRFSGSMALLQINEDEDEIVRYREMLEQEQIPLAPIWVSDDEDGRLVTTSIERIKGLEYDVCFIIGLEQAENATLNFNKNRVYVALSRPTRRLYMLCEHFPSLLQGISNDLYDIFDAR